MDVGETRETLPARKWSTFSLSHFVPRGLFYVIILAAWVNATRTVYFVYVSLLLRIFYILLKCNKWKTTELLHVTQQSWSTHVYPRCTIYSNKTCRFLSYLLVICSKLCIILLHSSPECTLIKHTQQTSYPYFKMFKISNFHRCVIYGRIDGNILKLFLFIFQTFQTYFINVSYFIIIKNCGT